MATLWTESICKPCQPPKGSCYTHLDDILVFCFCARSTVIIPVLFPAAFYASKGPDRKMLSGLTPVGVTFVIVVLLAMTIGLSAAVWYSWVAPCIARKRAQQQLRRVREASNTPVFAESPDLEAGRKGAEQKDPWPATSSTDSLGKASDKENLNLDHDQALRPPAPAYMFQKKFRFSTSTQDGVWWFV